MSNMAIRSGEVPMPYPGVPPKKEQAPVKMGRRKFLKLSLLTGTGVAVAGAYATIPAVKHAVDNTVHDILQNLGVETPTFFNNQAKQGMIGENNVIKVSQDEINRQVPTAFAKIDLGSKDVISLPQEVPPGADKNMFPDIKVAIGDKISTLQLEYPLDLTTSLNPKAPLTYEKSFAGNNQAVREKFKNTGIFDIINFRDVPGGTIVRSPVDGILTIYRSESTLPPNGSDSTGATLDFIAPNGNHYRLMISGGTIKDYQDQYVSSKTPWVFKSLINTAPIASPENKYQAQSSLTVKRGQPILQLLQHYKSIETVGFRVSAQEGEIGKSPDATKPSIPTNIELLTTPDGKVMSPK